MICNLWSFSQTSGSFASWLELSKHLRPSSHQPLHFCFPTSYSKNFQIPSHLDLQMVCHQPLVQFTLSTYLAPSHPHPNPRGPKIWWSHRRSQTLKALTPTLSSDLGFPKLCQAGSRTVIDLPHPTCLLGWPAS